MIVSHSIKRDAGFTLIELMVAVVVLLVVMIAVGRIFSMTSDVSASGVAISETLQQAVAIEQQLREDIAKVSDDGFFAIRHVAVSNNIYQYFLIDETQPESAIIRFDQLVFVRLGTVSPVGLSSGGHGDFAGQTFASVVYYGHGVSFPDLASADQGGNTIYSEDPELLIQDFDDNPVITPWYQGTVDFNTTVYSGNDDDVFDDTGTDGTTNATQPLPAKWMLCRQSTALGDDDQGHRAEVGKTSYVVNGLSTHSIFPDDPRFNDVDPQVLRGRVDIVSTHLGDIRQSILHNFDPQGYLSGGPRIWAQPGVAGTLDQQELIASLLQWPRVEALPPSSFRNDQMLMMHGLSQGVVSFQIEWMYEEGVGQVTSPDGVLRPGYHFPNNYPQPWWGGSYRPLPDDPASDINFITLTEYHMTATPWDDYRDWFDDPDAFSSYDPVIDHVASEAVWPNTASSSYIERQFQEGEGPEGALIPTVYEGVPSEINEYWSIFGYNGTNPFTKNQNNFVNFDSFTSDSFIYSHRYTPRPSALRITMRLLDRESRLGVGWTYQFVVDLPEIVQ